MPKYTTPVYAPNFFTTEDISDSYSIPGLSAQLGGSAPDIAQYRGTIYLPAFAGTGPTTEQAYFGVHIQNTIKPKSTLHLIIHCSHNIDSGTYTAGTSDVKWYVDYTKAKVDGTFGAETTLSSVITMDAQYVHHATSHEAMSIDGSLEPDEVILGRIYRDPGDVADTFGYDCFLCSIQLHYTVGQMGTDEESPPFTQFA